MRKLIFLGLTLSSTLAVLPIPDAMAESEWCRLARAEGGRECTFHTFEQCAASTERLNGGGCVENPYFHGPIPPRGGVQAVPANVRSPSRHKRRHEDASR
jgi:hypothetical protein